MKSLLDLAPYKIGDRVYNEFGQELEIVMFDMDFGILCDDTIWYDACQLHYSHESTKKNVAQ